jgi:hypothetical protein
MQQVIACAQHKKQLKELESELANVVPRFAIGSLNQPKSGQWCDWPIYLPIDTTWRVRRNCGWNGALNLECGEVMLTLLNLGERVQLYAGNPWRAISCGRAVLALIIKRLAALDTPNLAEASRTALRRFVDEAAQL